MSLITAGFDNNNAGFTSNQQILFIVEGGSSFTHLFDFLDKTKEYWDAVDITYFRGYSLTAPTLGILFLNFVPTREQFEQYYDFIIAAAFPWMTGLGMYNLAYGRKP